MPFPVFADYRAWAASEGFEVEQLILAPRPVVDPDQYRRREAPTPTTD